MLNERADSPEESLDKHTKDLTKIEVELISSQKRNDELSRIIKEMEKTQQRLIEEKHAILSVKVVSEVEIQTDSQFDLPSKTEIKKTTISKKVDRQKLEESSRYATSVGVFIIFK